MTTAVEVESVALVVDRRVILDDVSFAVEESETLALAGPSGSGKTSLLRVILGLVAPTRGTVRLREEVVSREGHVVVPPERRRLAMVFQDLALWPHLSVHGNVAFALREQGMARAERERRVMATLESVGLASARDRRPTTLSGGERQRVAIARALVTAPDLVLFDEALASLDVALREEILALLGALLIERKAAAICVSHEPREARRLASRIAVIEAGRLVQIGSPASLMADPKTPFVRAFCSG